MQFLANLLLLALKLLKKLKNEDQRKMYTKTGNEISIVY